MIFYCGELPGDADDGVVNVFKDGDMYPDWPNDLDQKPTEVSWWMDAVESAKAFGSDNFKVISDLDKLHPFFSYGIVIFHWFYGNQISVRMNQGFRFCYCPIHEC